MAKQFAQAAWNRPRDNHLELNPVSGLYEPAVLLERWERSAALKRPNPGSAATGYTQFCTLTDNQGTAPDGTNTAFKVTEDTNNVYHNLADAIAILAASGTQIIIREWWKAGTITQCVVGGNGYSTGATGSYVDLTNASIIAAGSGQTVTALMLEGGWVEITWKFTNTNANEIKWSSGLALSGAASYLGNGSRYAYVWGQQISVGRNFLGSYPISTQAQSEANNGFALAPPAGDPTSAFFVSTGPNRYGTPRAPDGAFELPAGNITSVPSAFTGFIEFIEKGSAQTSGAGVWALCKPDGTGARLVISTGTTGYLVTHHNGTSSVTSELAAFPAFGSLVRLRWTFGADGKVQIFQSVNAAAETNGSLSSALTPAGAWGALRIYLGSIGSVEASQGFIAVRRSYVLPSASTLSDFLSLP